MHKFTTITIIMAAAGCAQGSVVTRYDGDTGGTGTAPPSTSYIIGATGSVIVEHVGGAGGATTSSDTVDAGSGGAVNGEGGAGGGEPDAGPPLVACCGNSECPALAPCLTGYCQHPFESTCDEARCNAFCRCAAGGTPMSTGTCVPGAAWTCVCAT